MLESIDQVGKYYPLNNIELLIQEHGVSICIVLHPINPQNILIYTHIFLLCVCMFVKLILKKLNSKSSVLTYKVAIALCLLTFYHTALAVLPL